MIDWSKYWPLARDVLARSPRNLSTAEQLAAVSDVVGYAVSPDALKQACQRYERCGVREILGTASAVSNAQVRQPAPVRSVRDAVDSGTVREDDRAGKVAGSGVEELVRLARKGIGFHDLCDRLDMSPRRVNELISAAKTAGYRVDVAGDTVAWKEPEESQAYDVNTDAAPVIRGRAIVAAISDTHFGSKYCMRDELREFIQHAYDAGARQVLHAGDILDGCYKHGQWELSHHGVDDQIEDALATLPQLDGLVYHCTTGNHDETYTTTTGLDTGRLIEDRARRAGRKDIRYHGCRGARLRLGNVRVELWHPRSGNSYALSYQLQNHIRDYPVGVKPDILIAGHWHRAIYFEQRGVHAMSAPCWQSGLSSFGKSLGGSPSIGGWLLSWETTQHGTLRRFAAERSAYYDREGFRDVEEEERCG